MIAGLLSFSYMTAVTLLSVYGLLGLFTLLLYRRHKGSVSGRPEVSLAQLPSVTIQLPIFNERFVVERLIKAASEMEYPSDRLQIQVVDDSTDDTSDIVASVVEYYRLKGVNIQHVHRPHRLGYKAGALADAMQGAEGEYLAIFDADFQPHPDFLIHTIPHFCNSPDLGMIQARWGHLNASDSPLTAAQSIALDKHFVMEQSVRHKANLFPKFNGAAGIWRRTCIEDAGGWQSDTVCEDLCLSTRAVLKGWQFRFLPEIVAPAELPTSISAYKNQQARWAKGSIQCLQKYSGAIIKDRNYSLVARFYALLSMSAYMTHFLLLFLILLQIPLIILDIHFPSWMLIFTIFGLGQPLLFVLAQKESYSDWVKRLIYFPTLLFVAVGTAPSNGKAMAQAFLGKDHLFVRTPKGFVGAQSPKYRNSSPYYRLPFDKVLLAELFLFVYAVVGLVLAVARNNPGPVFLLFTSILGFGYVAYLGIREMLPIELPLFLKK